MTVPRRTRFLGKGVGPREFLLFLLGFLTKFSLMDILLFTLESTVLSKSVYDLYSY